MLLRKNPIICALDTKNIDVARELILDLHDDIEVFKVGLEYFIANTMIGMNAVGLIAMHNDKPSAGNPGTYWVAPKLFLDLKFHDIPKTVYGAVASLHEYRQRGQDIIMTTVHASGGVEMMQQAVEAADKKFKIIAVTLLTSLAEKNATDIVLKRTEDALNAGVDGIVCSPKEVKKVRHTFGDDFTIITPGIRPKGTKKADQKRIGTPKKALKDGSTYLVIGRPITQADDPKEAVKTIINSFD